MVLNREIDNKFKTNNSKQLKKINLGFSGGTNSITQKHQQLKN